MMSRVVLAQGSNSHFSHVGMILVRDTDVLVVHAIPPEPNETGGVVIEALANFSSARNAASIAFYRLRQIDPSERSSIRTYLLGQVGKPFDAQFSMNDDASVYCTELVVKALTTVRKGFSNSVQGAHVFGLAELVLPPESLRSSSFLDRISYDNDSDTETARFRTSAPVPRG